MAMGSRPRLNLGTVQVTVGDPCTHLEHWPAGFTLCGIDLFPPEDPPGFSRGGGQTGSWEEPCCECLRRAKRFVGAKDVRVIGLPEAARLYMVELDQPRARLTEEQLLDVRGSGE